MCFSQPGSLAFFALGAGTGLFLKARGSPRRRYQLFLYFALMELIQFGVSLSPAIADSSAASHSLHAPAYWEVFHGPGIPWAR